MFFTKDDYRKIEEWLSHRVTEKIAIGNANIKGVGNDYGREVHIFSPDFYNVSLNAGKGYITLAEAVSLVPQDMRIFGLAITFLDPEGIWRIYQFAGLSFAQWDDVGCWQSPYDVDVQRLVPFPDEEDITSVTQGTKTFWRFKDRYIEPNEFISRGYEIVRRNIVPSTTTDDWQNYLVDKMMSKKNTTYEIRYDFDLRGNTLQMPQGCNIVINGGSINNGTIVLDRTGIKGAWEFADMGTAVWIGTFKTGQVMTFLNTEATSLTGEYFVAGTRDSSSLIYDEDEQEAYYVVNEDAWTTTERQELKWWNGEEWVLLLDQTDYDTLYAIIEDVIDKIDYDTQAIYAYFKNRMYYLEERVEDCEENITNIWATIADIQEDITEINSEITNIWTIIEEIETDIDNVENSIEEIYLEINEIKVDIDEINTSIENINNKIENLGDTINNYSSGDTVSVSNVNTSGTKIVTITINGEDYDIYAPTAEEGMDSDDVGELVKTLVSYSATVTSGTILGYLVVDEEKTPIYAPTVEGGADSDEIINIIETTVSYDASVTSGTILGYLVVNEEKTPIYAPTVSDSSGSSDYTLPIATASVLGGVMIGDGIKVTTAGVISADIDYIEQNVDVTKLDIGDININNFDWTEFDITLIEQELNEWIEANIVVTPILTSGTEIATIKIGDADAITLYAPTSLGSSLSTGDLYWTLSGTSLYAGTSTESAEYEVYATAFYESSDERLKEHIEHIDKTELDKVDNVTLKQFFMNNQFKYGVIAQELEAVGLGNLVSTNKDGYKSVDYIAFLILEIESLKKKLYAQGILE